MEKTLKPLPKSATKSEINTSWYPNIPRRTVTSIMNHAILEANKKRPEKLQRSIMVNTLYGEEIDFIIMELGTPNGFEDTEGV